MTSESQPDTNIAHCEQALGYQFSDRSLLVEALTHASGASHRLLSNERLEFLGDSILGFIVCQLLFERYPDWDEGELTRVKSVAVSRTTCAKIGRALNIDQFLIVGKGMESNSNVPQSLLSNAIESIIAAIYLDSGLDAVRTFILPYIEKELDSIVSGQFQPNFKSDLQRISQKHFGEPPIYQLVDQKGPDHDKCFQMCATIGDRQFPPAWGNNKKQAEQLAASNALEDLKKEGLLED